MLLHDNFRPHVSHKTTDEIRIFGCTTVKHPPYSPDMAACDYHPLSELKESLRKTRFEDKDSLVNAAEQWLRLAGSDFNRAGISKVAKGS